MNSGLVTGPVAYWESRALRYARSGAGLGAVCSYGMPAYYNLFIDVCQRLALGRWLRHAAGREALDIGCGVGRWSLRMARRAQSVTGVDWSPTMVAEARRRAQDRGLASKCAFLVADATGLSLGRRFGFILGVTVFQHILDEETWRTTIQAVAGHLADDGLLVSLEASPTRPDTRCDSPVFRARPAEAYRAAFERAGLTCVAITGVDPAPFRPRLLPPCKGRPRGVRDFALAAVTTASLALDLPAGRRWVSPSWHKVFVLRRIDSGG